MVGTDLSVEDKPQAVFLFRAFQLGHRHGGVLGPLSLRLSPPEHHNHLSRQDRFGVDWGGADGPCNYGQEATSSLTTGTTNHVEIEFFSIGPTCSYHTQRCSCQIAQGVGQLDISCVRTSFESLESRTNPNQLSSAEKKDLGLDTMLLICSFFVARIDNKTRERERERERESANKKKGNKKRGVKHVSGILGPVYADQKGLECNLFKCLQQ